VKASGRVLVVAWLVAALLVLWLDGRLDDFVVWMVPSSALLVVVGAVIRWQRAPSRFNRPSLPDAYRLADDLAVPLVVVVEAAEREA
jgi:hypothetical protein